MNQTEFSRLVGITRQAVGDMVKRKVINLNETAGKCLIKYCAHLRETAGGHTGELAEARTRLASVGHQIAGLLEALPVKIKRDAKLKTKQIKVVEKEIPICRNIAAMVRPDWSQIDVNEED